MDENALVGLCGYGPLGQVLLFCDLAVQTF